jgi:hypothetical protein
MSSPKIFICKGDYAASVYPSEARHLKKYSFKGTLRQVFICLRPRIPYPPPPTLTHCIHGYTVYSTYSHREGGEGGELNQRED